MSITRKIYFARLAGRCVILAICIALSLLCKDCFSVLDGFGFFQRLSPLHFLWGIWVIDMLLQIIPIKKKVPVGVPKTFHQSISTYSGEGQL